MTCSSLRINFFARKKKFIALIFYVAFINFGFGQDLQSGQKRWSADSKLALHDFKIHTSDQSNELAYSQFMISHAIGGLDFMKKNFNQKIDNIFLGTASYIDTKKMEDVQKQLDFQQMQFDLSEIQARKFRKEILLNKKKLTKGFDIVQTINNNIMEDLTKMRMQLMKDTDSGRDIQKILEWKQRIATELNELSDYRFGNKEKIKVN